MNTPLPSPAPVPPTSTLAVVSLVFGITCWIVLPLIGSIAAVITGHLARREIAAAEGRLGGDGLALAGMVLGWIQLALTIVAIVLLVLALVFGFSLLALFAASQ